MKRRDYNLMSIIIVQFITVIITGIISSLIGGTSPTNFSQGVYYNTNSFRAGLASFINALVGIVSGFIIARGLLRNRNGSVGEYLDNINYLNSTIILANFFVRLITTLATIILSGFVGITIFSTFATTMAGSTGGFGASLIFMILGIILLFVYTLFVAYTEFVVADNYETRSIGSLIRMTFATGKDLLSKTIVTYLKWVVVPVLVFFIVFALATRGVSGGVLMGGLSITLLILATLFILVYAVVVRAFIKAELSDTYLNYKENYFTRL